jgi:hypothetical protein
MTALPSPLPRPESDDDAHNAAGHAPKSRPATPAHEDEPTSLSIPFPLTSSPDQYDEPHTRPDPRPNTEN